MTSSPRGMGLIAAASSSVGASHADQLVRRGFNPRLPQPGGSPEMPTLNRADLSLVASAKKARRILLVDAALALRELHLRFLRSIPAIVETLTSYAEMYFNRERAYALVILALYPQSRETAEAAHFVRHRWSTARILLLESGPVVIDDWLYDERVDPHLHPAIMRDAAMRLMAEETYWIPE